MTQALYAHINNKKKLYVQPQDKGEKDGYSNSLT
jgi:hypothetical protein